MMDFEPPKWVVLECFQELINFYWPVAGPNSQQARLCSQLIRPNTIKFFMVEKSLGGNLLTRKLVVGPTNRSRFLLIQQTQQVWPFTAAARQRLWVAEITLRDTVVTFLMTTRRRDSWTRINHGFAVWKARKAKKWLAMENLQYNQFDGWNFKFTTTET